MEKLEKLLPFLEKILERYGLLPLALGLVIFYLIRTFSSKLDDAAKRDEKASERDQKMLAILETQVDVMKGQREEIGRLREGHHRLETTYNELVLQVSRAVANRDSSTGSIGNVRQKSDDK